jgi:hypothetical protein
VDGRRIYKKTLSLALPSITSNGTYNLGSLASLLPGADYFFKIDTFRISGNSAVINYFSYTMTGGNVVLYNATSNTITAETYALTFWYVKP